MDCWKPLIVRTSNFRNLEAVRRLVEAACGASVKIGSLRFKARQSIRKFNNRKSAEMDSVNHDQTAIVEDLIGRLRSGNLEAREELIEVAANRLLRLTRKLKSSFERSVGRWEQTEDIFQRANFRLYQSLEKVELNDAAHFFNLAATQIRRELIDLTRHYKGVNARYLTRNADAAGEASADGRESPMLDPAEATGNVHELELWSEFHAAINELPEQLKTVVDLLWYHQMSQNDAARVLETSERNIRRLWRSARLQLDEKFDGLLSVD